MTEKPASAETNRAISPDSGLLWTEEGAWRVDEGVYRIPLPLPNDGLRAINVYVLETEAGLTLIDGGWHLALARDVLDRSLDSIGHSLRDITGFLVTHVHRDHYTMASALGRELGVPAFLGMHERAALELMHAGRGAMQEAFDGALLACGAPELRNDFEGEVDLTGWGMPDGWIDDGRRFEVGDRVIEAVHTPGHTPGHLVFADRSAGQLFAGDHVLPTITPSIGFVFPLPGDPLSDFLASLARVRSLPDLRLLPAHGPVAPSTHTRVDELLAFHEERLGLCAAALDAGPSTAAQVAALLPWTRHHRTYASLDSYNQRLAVFETRAHLEVLVARGQAVAQGQTPVVYSAVPAG